MPKLRTQVVIFSRTRNRTTKSLTLSEGTSRTSILVERPPTSALLLLAVILHFSQKIADCLQKLVYNAAKLLRRGSIFAPL